MKRQTIFKLISILIGLLFGLIITEVGFRVYHRITYQSLMDINENRPPVERSEEELKLGQVVQVSSNKKIIYELVPNSKYKFKNVLVETNEQGFRDKNYPVKKVKKTRRVIGLGDSIMFGWGVEEKKSYLTRLENKLNQEKDSFQYEIINTAVPGYNTVMEIETFQEKIDASQVDLVIINYVHNDLDLPNFIRKKPVYSNLNELFMIKFFSDDNGFDERLRGAPFDGKNWKYQSDTTKIPAEYHDMVGMKSYQTAMKKLQKLSETHQFKVIVLSHRPTANAPEAIKTISEELGFEFVVVGPTWLEFKAKNPEIEWKIAPDDFHPTPAGHQIISEVLEEKVIELFEKK